MVMLWEWLLCHTSVMDNCVYTVISIQNPVRHLAGVWRRSKRSDCSAFIFLVHPTRGREGNIVVGKLTLNGCREHLLSLQPHLNCMQEGGINHHIGVVRWIVAAALLQLGTAAVLTAQYKPSIRVRVCSTRRQGVGSLAGTLFSIATHISVDTTCNLCWKHQLSSQACIHYY